MIAVRSQVYPKGMLSVPPVAKSSKRENGEVRK